MWSFAAAALISMLVFADTVFAQSGGICSRTPEVRAALLEEVQLTHTSVTDCSQVTNTHLEGLTGTLHLSNLSIASLMSGDLAGLTALRNLDLGGNLLARLPDGIFDDLGNLRFLYLNGNALTGLPDGIFDDLGNLAALYLNGNALTGLPDGIFDDLGDLTVLYLNGNELTVLRDGVFDNLSRLSILLLDDNNLVTLPNGVLANLTRLSDLTLTNNPGTFNFRPIADVGNDRKEPFGGTVMLSSSVRGPWGTNVTYAWTVTDTQGAAVTGVTLTGADTATPSFTMPTPVPEGGLRFTLAVQGKGYSGRFFYRNVYESSDSMTVTAFTPLSVTSVALASAPVDGTTYRNGESIEVAVNFAGTATVDTSGGTPNIGLTVGTATRAAAYRRGSGSRQLVFAYRVQSSDRDTDGVSVSANSLARNGGRIVDAGGGAFRLTHSALAADSDHQVNGSLTRLTGGVCDRTPAVRDLLLQEVRSSNATVTNCSQVTRAHLQALTGTLDLSDKGIVALKSEDFDDLTGLTGLSLNDNDLVTLPSAIFANLTGLTGLRLNDNDLATLPDGYSRT